MRDFDVTSAGVSAEQDRVHRMKVYFIMMVIRFACVISLVWVRGWWIILVAAGAIFLPYIAVLIANEAANSRGKVAEQPEQLQITGSEPEPEDPAQTVIVIDAPAERRAKPATDELPDAHEETE